MFPAIFVKADLEVYCCYVLCEISFTLVVSPVQFPGKDAPSTVITFAQKTVKDGTMLSKLHVIELGGAGGIKICT